MNNKSDVSLITFSSPLFLTPPPLLTPQLSFPSYPPPPLPAHLSPITPFLYHHSPLPSYLFVFLIYACFLPLPPPLTSIPFPSPFILPLFFRSTLVIPLASPALPFSLPLLQLPPPFPSFQSHSLSPLSYPSLFLLSRSCLNCSFLSLSSSSVSFPSPLFSASSLPSFQFLLSSLLYSCLVLLSPSFSPHSQPS